MNSRRSMLPVEGHAMTRERLADPVRAHPELDLVAARRRFEDGHSLLSRHSPAPP